MGTGSLPARTRWVTQRTGPCGTGPEPPFPRHVLLTKSGPLPGFGVSLSVWGAQEEVLSADIECDAWRERPGTELQLSLLAVTPGKAVSFVTCRTVTTPLPASSGVVTTRDTHQRRSRSAALSSLPRLQRAWERKECAWGAPAQCVTRERALRALTPAPNHRRSRTQTEVRTNRDPTSRHHRTVFTNKTKGPHRLWTATVFPILTWSRAHVFSTYTVWRTHTNARNH